MIIEFIWFVGSKYVFNIYIFPDTVIIIKLFFLNWTDGFYYSRFYKKKIF